MAEAVFFYIFSTLMILAALSVVISRQPIYSVLSLLVVMFSAASLFVMLEAFFLAALQVLLYAGAVLVLFLFVIMLLNLERESFLRMRAFTLRAAGILAASFLFLHLVRILRSQTGESAIFPTSSITGGVEAIGKLLFTAYLLPFELISFLILAAIIGAVTLAKQENADK